MTVRFPKQRQHSRNVQLPKSSGTLRELTTEVTALRRCPTSERKARFSRRKTPAVSVATRTKRWDLDNDSYLPFFLSFDWLSTYERNGQAKDNLLQWTTTKTTTAITANFPYLKKRCTQLSHSLLYKIVNGLVDLSSAPICLPEHLHENRYSEKTFFIVPKLSTNSYQFPFFPHTLQFEYEVIYQGT